MGIDNATSIEKLARGSDFYINSADNVGIGTSTPVSLLEVDDSGYLQFDKASNGTPTAADCDSSDERGRLAVDTTGNRLYVCNGATRGWDYISLTDS